MEWEQKANDIHFFPTFGQLAYISPSFCAQRLKQWQKEENEV